MEYDVYVGVDQTGAVISSGPQKGRPKPLPAAVLHGEILHAGYSLRSFNSKEILGLVESVTKLKKPRVFVAVDCVLGLPKACGVSFNELLESVIKYQSRQSKNGLNLFGRDAAFDFFLQFLKPTLQKELRRHGRIGGRMSGRSRDGTGSADKLPVRRCEELAKANSVFHRVPAQRNIGCGSYRILSDLAADLSTDFVAGRATGLAVWPHHPLQINAKGMTIQIAETYPSLMWKKLGISQTRNQAAFRRYCRGRLTTRQNVNASRLTDDHIDAAVSAIGAKHVLENENFFASLAEVDFEDEGWILGLS